MLHNTLMKGAALAVLLTAAALGRPAAAQTIDGAGATFPYPIYTKWFNTYHDEHSGVTINYQAVGSGAGISQYNAGTVDFGASDAPPTDAEMKKPTVLIPTVAGSIVLAYNVPGVGPGLKLTGPVIADIFLGKIKAWNDPAIKKLNPGINLPGDGITVAHRADGSGTTYIFTHYLAAVSSEWQNGPGAGKTVNWPTGVGGNQNAGVASLIKSQAGGIGYVELAYAIQNKLTYGPVRNKSGNYVLASIPSTTAAAEVAAPHMQRDVRISIVDGPGVNTYPICGFTYLLVPRHPRDAARGHALTEFLKWAMGPGQDMAEGLLYSPLPKSVVAINLRALSAVQTASR